MKRVDPHSQTKQAQSDGAPSWFTDGLVRPFLVASNLPGEAPNHLLSRERKHHFDWFKTSHPLVIQPLRSEGLLFMQALQKLDDVLFGRVKMQMPKWVFYDCAVMPGLMSGFAIKRSALPEHLEVLLEPPTELEWVPISLFIMIPMIQKRHWMAHNLCSINEILPRGERMKGLGFLSKAFGLWAANAEHLCGVVQWMKPALKLHANYGFFEIVTAVTPLHDHFESITYRMDVNSSHWMNFFEPVPEFQSFEAQFEWSGLMVFPSVRSTLTELQQRIERVEGPFFLRGSEVLSQPLGTALHLYRAR